MHKIFYGALALKNAEISLILGMGGSQNFVHSINREKIPRYIVYRDTLFCDSSKPVFLYLQQEIF